MNALIPGRILVIEDVPLGRVLMEQTLSRAGHEVTLASTGADGLLRIASARFDLVVIDKNLPDADGIRLMRTIRSSHPQVRAIVVSGDRTAPAQIAAEGLGGLAYLGKPFAVRQLLSMCSAALSDARPDRGAQPTRVLVVDDDDTVGRLAREVLTRAAFEVEVAVSAGAAIAALQRQAFDLLLVDRYLPGTDGLELLRSARKKLPDVAVIMMTAGEAPPDEVRSQMDGYLTKPFHNLRALVDEIRKALESRPRSKESR